MNTIANMISSYRGYLHERAGFIIGFFDDPDDARHCANSIRESLGIDVEINGCQLTFVDRRLHNENYSSAKDRRETSNQIQ